MAYLPGFKHDIFISYAHRDNQKGNDDAEEWVTQFHEILKLKLQNRLSKRVSIWRDPKLRGNDLFDQKIEEAITGAGLFIALNSDNYVISKYCRQELEQFYAKAKSERWGVDIDRRKRVFNVMLNNIPEMEWNAAFKGTTGYRFFKEKHDSNTPPRVQTNTKAFAADIESLAGDLAGTLQAFKAAIWRKRITALGIGILILAVAISTVYIYETMRTRKAAPVENRPDDVRGNVWAHDPTASPTPVVFNYAEDVDKLNNSLQQWTPQGLGWSVDPDSEPFGRLIGGNSLGLFKTKQVKSQPEFNKYQDFTLNFAVQFIGKKGVAWVVRAKDFNNYYQFELTKAKGPWPAELNCYIVEHGEPTPIPDGYTGVSNISVENDQDNLLIQTSAKGNKFVISILPPDHAELGFQKLVEFNDDRNTFTSGGIGFNPKDGREVLLQQLIIAYPNH